MTYALQIFDHAGVKLSRHGGFTAEEANAKIREIQSWPHSKDRYPADVAQKERLKIIKDPIKKVPKVTTTQVIKRYGKKNQLP